MAFPACCSVNSLSVRRFALFMLLVIVYASIFIGRLSDAGHVPGRRGCSGGRRALLALDEEVGEDPLPKKIKKSLVGEEPQVLKNKKVSTEVEGSEEEKPKKKQASVGEEKPKKKKASVEDLEEEKPKKKKAIVQDLEEIVLKKKKASVQDVEEEIVTKKKKATVANEDHSDADEEQPLLVKKKPITKMEKVDEDQPLKKKKKIAIVEEDENQATQNKKKKVVIDDEDTQKKKTKPLTADGLEKPKKKMAPPEVEAEAETVGKPLKKKKLTPIVNNNEEEMSNYTKKKGKFKITEELPIKLKTSKPTTKNLTAATTTTDTIKPAKPKQPKEEDADLITDFKDLPSKLATSIIPDLERISTTSQVYLKKANKELSQSFKPLVGTKYASLIASFFSYLFLLAPIIIFPILYARIRNYFLPLQTIVVFTQIYLAIYFAVLVLSVFITGQEPLRFFYATSKASFLYTQLLQTLGYALFLLLLVVYLVVVFSSKESSAAPRAVALAQMVVGLVVGAHYYVAVAHRAVLREPPLTNWKVHSGYSALFVGVCLLARAERRKKAYLHDGGEVSKTS